MANPLWGWVQKTRNKVSPLPNNETLSVGVKVSGIPMVLIKNVLWSTSNQTLSMQFGQTVQANVLIQLSVLAFNGLRIPDNGYRIRPQPFRPQPPLWKLQEEGQTQGLLPPGIRDPSNSPMDTSSSIECLRGRWFVRMTSTVFSVSLQETMIVTLDISFPH